MLKKRIILSLLINGTFSFVDTILDESFLFAKNTQAAVEEDVDENNDSSQAGIDDQDDEEEERTTVDLYQRTGLQLVLTLDAGTIGKFEENDSNDYGPSFGYSLNIGYMPASYVSFYTGVNTLMGSVDHGTSEELNHTGFADFYLGTKLYPLGDALPIFYLNLGYIPYSAFHFSDEFFLLSEEEGRRSYRGHGFLAGLGYEQPINKNIFLSGEGQYRFHEYNRRATSEGEITLDQVARGNVYLIQFGMGLIL